MIDFHESRGPGGDDGRPPLLPAGPVRLRRGRRRPVGRLRREADDEPGWSTPASTCWIRHAWTRSTPGEPLTMPDLVARVQARGGVARVFETDEDWIDVGTPRRARPGEARRMSELSGRPVLVTGSDGFIGSHLVERLVAEGARVRAFCLYNSQGSLGWLDGTSPDVRAAIDVRLGDIRDAGFVAEACLGMDVVFHLAALDRDPVLLRRTGVLRLHERGRDDERARRGAAPRGWPPHPHLDQRGLRHPGSPADPRGPPTAMPSRRMPRRRWPRTSWRCPTTGASASR